MSYPDIFGGAAVVPGGFTVPGWLTVKLTTPGASIDDGVDRGLLVEQQHLLKGDVVNLSRRRPQRPQSQPFSQ